MNRRRSVGVPPASSPSVSLDEVRGGGTPPELAAGTATLRHAPMHGQSWRSKLCINASVDANSARAEMARAVEACG